MSSDRAANLTDEQVGAHFWGLSFPYDEIADYLKLHNLTGHDLEKVQAGWKEMNESFDEWCKKGHIE